MSDIAQLQLYGTTLEPKLARYKTLKVYRNKDTRYAVIMRIGFGFPESLDYWEVKNKTPEEWVAAQDKAFRENFAIAKGSA